MKIGPGGATLRQIGRLFEGDSVAGLGEARLLERFVSRRDEPAFAALVARHGPMVLGVCRRILDDPSDVEDAFQATFLVLIRRAGSIRDGDRLASWLFGVARKVASRARLDASRRKARERPGAEESAEAPAFDGHRAELGRALIEEIDRLPEALRDPLVLCCVEGLTYDEAADRLGSTGPAIRGRLSRARERLRGRLTRRGFAPASVAIAATLSAEAAPAAVPATLLSTTIRVAIGDQAGRAAAGAVPAAVAHLAEGVIRTMILTKSKIVAATLIACGVVGTSVGVLGQESAPPPADRLGGLEMKLDRLIQIMENANRPTAGPVVPPPVTFRSDSKFAPVEDTKPAGPSALPAGRPGGQTQFSVEDTKPADPAALPGMGDPGMMSMMGGMMGRGSNAKASSSAASARLDAVEQKLERLEARLAEVERKLGALVSPVRSVWPNGRRPGRSADELKDVVDQPKVNAGPAVDPFRAAPK